MRTTRPQASSTSSFDAPPGSEIPSRQLPLAGKGVAALNRATNRRRRRIGDLVHDAVRSLAADHAAGMALDHTCRAAGAAGIEGDRDLARAGSVRQDADQTV